MSKQVGMGTGAIKRYLISRFFYTVNEKPVRFNMTFPFTFIITMQRVIFMFWRQWVFIYKQIHYLIEFINISILFNHELAILFERTCKNCIQHGLIIRIQIYKHFFKRAISFCRYFSSEYSVSLRNRRFSFGIIKRFSGNRIAVFRAYRAVFLLFFGFSRNVNGLSDGHALKIA